MRPALEILRLTPAHEAALGTLFAALVAAGSEEFFHPHSFDAATARAIAGYAGADLYFGAVNDGVILAYGMLRGWDEGYEVPSLGIAVHPAHRGCSVGRTMMHFLHSAAVVRGATRIRLTVHPANHGAIQLYRSLGYAFTAEGADRLIGLLPLVGQPKP